MRLTQLAIVAPLRRASHFSLRVCMSFLFHAIKLGKVGREREEGGQSLRNSLVLALLSHIYSRILFSLSLSLYLTRRYLSLSFNYLISAMCLSLHKLFKNNILHTIKCMYIYRRHLIRIKFVKQHRKVALTGPGNMITATQCRASIIQYYNHAYISRTGGLYEASLVKKKSTSLFFLLYLYKIKKRNIYHYIISSLLI